jgi:hypothetical protein
MLKNIAQRLSRLWARVANLNELTGNSDSLERGIEIMKTYPDLEGSATERKMTASYKMLEAYKNNDPMVRQNLDMSFVAYCAATENNIKLFRTGVPHGRVVELIGAHHLIYLSNQADVLRELDLFMREIYPNH